MKYCILLLIFIASCCKPDTPINGKLDVRLNGQLIETITIDGCEYLYQQNSSATWMCHKGNCKTCINRTSK